jgi:hypothetical protein
VREGYSPAVGERITGEELERLVREYDALRRVATLVARQPPSKKSSLP